MSLNWSSTVASDVAARWTAEEPGGVLLAFDRHAIRIVATGGLASLSHRRAITADTRLRFASLTKHIFCAFALGHGLDPRETLGAMLPDLTGDLATVTAGQALGMSGGIPDLSPSHTLCGVPPGLALDGAALDAFTRELPGLDNPPGTEISYSNTGYRLVEQGLARRGAIFRDWVEGPLNAALGTGLRYPSGWDTPLPDLADGHWRDSPASGWRAGSYGMALSASGALTGSATDLALWLQALLRGDGPAGAVLSRLATPGVLEDGTVSAYGLGLALMEIGGRRWIGHGGHLPGFKSHFLLDAEAGAGVLLLSNREDTDPLLPALRVLASLLGVELPSPATALLPEGLFVEDAGPAWIEHRAGQLTFLGAREALFAAPDGAAFALSPYLPMHLHPEADGIAGTIGHVPRHFHPVAEGASTAAFAGRWRSTRPWLDLSIEMTPEGVAMAAMGNGPLRRPVPLTALDERRALMPVGAMPWPGRACLWLETPNRLRICTNRSRVICLERTGGGPQPPRLQASPSGYPRRPSLQR
ncbi:serine hydrolase domain-containing protein [Roseococcus sp.]|uniref:serine hydrolase domain-containing protein n=1 Tax=Roseococcus sp. TaxID=2109646 RepID=UPI003BAD68E0